MHHKHSAVHHTDSHPPAPATRWNIGKLVGRLVLLAVIGLAFVGYLTPDMRIQWANLMTLCGF